MGRKGSITKFEFHILSGLPGSGKTYFANHNFNDNTSVIIDLDRLKNNKNIDEKDIYKFLSQTLYRVCHYDSNITKVCIDGLLLTKESIRRIMDACIKYLNENISKSGIFGYEYTIKFIIHIWKRNNEILLHNDEYRMKYSNREQSSSITIKNAIFEEDMVKGNFTDLCESIKIIKHMPKKATIYTAKFEPLIGTDYNKYFGGHVGSANNGKSHFMYSESWCGGGTWGDCWGNEGTVSGEDALEFDAFDKLLEDLCPNITFLQYKKLRSATVTTDEFTEYDYYGGSTTNYRWKCDIEKLYELMIEMNLITEEE